MEQRKRPKQKARYNSAANGTSTNLTPTYEDALEALSFQLKMLKKSLMLLVQYRLRNSHRQNMLNLFEFI